MSPTDVQPPGRLRLGGCYRVRQPFPNVAVGERLRLERSVMTPRGSERILTFARESGERFNVNECDPATHPFFDDLEAHLAPDGTA